MEEVRERNTVELQHIPNHLFCRKGCNVSKQYGACPVSRVRTCRVYRDEIGRVTSHLWRYGTKEKTIDDRVVLVKKATRFYTCYRCEREICINQDYGTVRQRLENGIKLTVGRFCIPCLSQQYTNECWGSNNSKVYLRKDMLGSISRRKTAPALLEEDG